MDAILNFEVSAPYNFVCKEELWPSTFFNFTVTLEILDNIFRNTLKLIGTNSVLYVTQYDKKLREIAKTKH